VRERLKEEVIVLVVGANHKTAPLEVREKLAIRSERLKGALFSLSNYVEQGVILSTCNRTEVYALTEDPSAGEERVKGFLSAEGGIPLQNLSPHLYVLCQREAVKHLFEVATGVDSMAIGEAEILLQVRQAVEEAERLGISRFPLSNLFRRALRVGNRARAKTAIGRGATSISSAAVELARGFFADITRCPVLIIGAGEAGRLAAEALLKKGASEITIASRTLKRAKAVASVLGGRAIPLRNIDDALIASDIVISCSGAPHFILHSSLIKEVMKHRSERPLLLIDIAVPRDIEPEIRGIENVCLHDISDLKEITEAARCEREREIEKVLGLIDREGAHFMVWWDALKAVPTVKALVERAETSRQVQLSKALKKLQHLSEEDLRRIDYLTKAVVKGIIHYPIISLKKHCNSEYFQMVEGLFNLDEHDEG